MAELQVTVKVVKDDLNNLKKELEQLRKDAKEIKIDIKGEDTLKKLTDALQKYSHATVDGANALTKARQAEIDLTKAQANRINAATMLQRKQQEGINLDKKKTLEVEKQATAEKKLSIEQEKTTQTANRLATEQTRTERALTKTTLAASKLGDTWKRMFSAFSLSNIVSSGVTRAISQMRSYFNEALNEMKELDTALTHYRQVTGESQQQANLLGNRAYSVGSQYGTSASDYAESVATYARAGYKETADQLAELSLKTVIVGQTTQEIADQFLLTMDAAYGYKGSVEELSKVLDGASAIDSTYATTIEKIAAGLGLVAPLAQQVHVSEKELTAAIGTITAVTQRSGAESARALRSLFLNIIGDTTTEIEDGVTATEESVASLQSVLNKYAKSAVDAAKASGQVINPMEAIAALSESMKKGYLNEAELMDLLSGIGGKLRISQLVALVSNWDMYNDMIQTYEQSMGSADKKTKVYLESWEAKVNILKNTWTEFIAKTIDTDMFKGLLDGATKVLKLFGNLKNAVVLLGGAFTALKMGTMASSFAKAAQSSTQLADNLHAQAVTLFNAGKGADALGKSYEAMAAEEQAASASMKASMLGWASVAIGAITTVYSVYEMYHQQRMQALKEETDKAVEAAKSSKQKAEEIFPAYEIYENAKKAYDEGSISAETYESAVRRLTDALGEEAKGLENVTGALGKLSLEQLKAAQAEAQSAVRAARAEVKGDLQKLRINVLGANPIIDEYNATDQFGMLLPENVRFQRALNKYKEYADTRDKYLAGDKSISEADYMSAIGYLGKVSGAFETLLEQEGSVYDIGQQIAELEFGYGISMSAEEVAEATDEAGDSAEEATKQYYGLADAIDNARKSLEDYANATKAELDDDYTKFADAWKAAYEDIQKGMKGSNAVNAALDLFFTPEQIMRMHERGIEAADVIADDFWKSIFTYTDDKGELQFINDDAGANLAWKLYDDFANEAGQIVDKNGDVVASFEEADGLLSINIEDYEKLAQAMSDLYDHSIDPEVFVIMMEALGMYSTEAQETAEGFMSMAESMDALSGTSIDMDKFVQGLIDADVPTEKIMDYVEAIEKLRDEGEITTTYKIEAGEAEESYRVLIKKRDDLEKKKGEAKVKADTAKAESDLNRILIKEKQIADQSPTITVNIQDFASAKMQDILDKAKDKTVTINYKVNKPNGLQNGILQQASGTDSSPGGLTLVNEKGAEIIAENGRARIAGNGKPTLTWVQSGAQVFTASETRAILGDMDESALYDGINAYDKGVGIKRYEPKDSSSKGKSSTTGTGTGTGTGTSTTKGKTTSKSSDKDDQLEKLKGIVELRKSELTLLEAQDASIKKQIKKEREIYDALGDQIKYMKEKKYPQKEINALLTEQYKIQKSIADLEKKLYDDLGKAINKRIDDLNKKRDEEKDVIQKQIDALQEKNDKEQKSVELAERKLAVEEAEEKLRNTQNQRNVRHYNASTGQWEWVANANEVKSAQEALDDAKKSLKELRTERKLEKQIADLEKQQQDIDKKYDSQIDLLQKVLDSLEEPVISIMQAVKNIEKNATKDQASTIKALNTLLVKALGKKYKISTKNLYDDGGVLKGIGGIKGTQDDEVVLPPDITRNMLKPIATATLASRMNELRYLYGVTGSMAGTTNSHSIGSQHNGDLYTIGNVTLTEGQARSTTVYDLVQMTRGLRAYNAM